MCMSGGGGSGSSARTLRRGQLGTAQRGVSTSRVAGYDTVRKWSDPVTTTTRKWIENPAAKVRPGLSPEKNAVANRNTALTMALSTTGLPTPAGREIKIAQTAIAKAKAGAAFMGKRLKPGDKVALPNRGAFLGQTSVLKNADGSQVRNAGNVAKYGAYEPGMQKVATKAFVEVPDRPAAGQIAPAGYWKEETNTTRSFVDETTARMAKNAQQRTAVDDGSTARKKARAARSNVANANTQSRFASKRSRSLRIDTAGSQVSG